MCSTQLILLSHIARGPLAISVSDVLAVVTICRLLEMQGLPFRDLVATPGQGLLCRTECEPIT